ncbi:MAG TPA: LPXTG cell wall anchor domain-containing protein [Actinophytocola sp.]|uniref:LPXTG cell wall anchor domain-containing protein n=1 Tax=Actinophytocola sp. TaxID=1872138 RepID=UPI002DB57DDE|nr:LPXTG cell wall anchor domain-containing protein [Actinophytocola sp.]HEU5470307.1 LPXTG cell wall anchor domain-containing protein [Actinophytocola sp.]
MRASVVGVLLVGLLAGFGGATASADPNPPVDACVLTDKRVAELSGLVADGERWYAVNDGGTKSTVYVLTRDCVVERLISGPTDPYDVEDLARAQDGTFWLSDTGDNDKKRETVALIALTPAGKTTLYRLTYPDGPHDTEALLLDRDNVPYLITKNPLGSAEIYRPAGTLASPGPTALERVGAVRMTGTDTQGGPVPPLVGSVLVTGAASMPDGSAVALRTYTDAYLYAVSDGDLLAALGKEPVRVPLPNEQQGEAIAFEPDGTLVSASEGTGQPIRTVAGAAGLIAPSPAPAPEPETPATPPAGGIDLGASDEPGGQDGLPTLPAIGLTVVIIGGALLFLRRRRTR